MSAVDDGSVHWSQATSKKGVTFEIGRAINAAGPGTINAKTDGEGDKPPFGVSVDWTLGSSAWKPTDASVKTTAYISQYALYSYTGILPYDYILYFTNIGDKNYDYHFHDATGDAYEVKCFGDGDHYVRYKSQKPEILFITGI
ncbi:uncharacterized protein MYCFIDRAFT_77842 [Pseudocercospora fijiensis CIRAD86]|uniref:Uncharacterized protein n=1 Tax=Pseudocercospora fijiensis (strain CIRAD86) TaxID=383855 RepID=M3ASB9_PSEFD|nr:uncharacterized protein MYCFIDRAFT_77842 [Pseudocercospora fijiensis CIRAD86]EME80053.1 hypothetical protein MYCFIDRAFT_77842 [Pseudocercospora fijiensis CIRAD86]